MALGLLRRMIMSRPPPRPPPPATTTCVLRWHQPISILPYRLIHSSSYHPHPNLIKRPIVNRIPKEQEESDLSILKHLFQYIWPKHNYKLRARVGLAFGFLVLGKILNVQVPYLFKTIIDQLGATGQSQLDIMTVCGTVVLGYGAARVGASVFSELRSAIFGTVAQSAIRQVSRTIFHQLLNQDVSFHLSNQTGGLTRALDRGTKGISFVLSSMVFHVVPTAFEISIVCAILTNHFGVKYTFVTLLTTFVYVWFTVATTAWRTKFRREMNSSDNQASAKAIDSLVNIEPIHYFDSSGRETQFYDRALAAYEDAAIKTTTSLAFLNAGQASIFAVSLTVVMSMASNAILHGQLSVGDLVLINGLLFQLSVPLNFLGTVYREQRQAFTDMQALFALQNVQPKVVDSPVAKGLGWEAGVVSFNHVAFQHPNSSVPVIHDVSISVKPGEKIALVGPSGCGKSTLVKLLFRLYDPTKGSITIDTQNIRDVTLASLRARLSIVPQDTTLFNDTIEYNIKYGNPTASDAEMVHAAHQAQIHALIQSLPNQYKTKVGERGLILSGGERQRLVVARALLRLSTKDPAARILVLDESTSALDTFTESALTRAVDHIAMHDQVATIMIAHRLSTVRSCDRIYVMDLGRVVESGTHLHLMSIDNGLYRSMWLDQFRKGIKSRRLDSPAGNGLHH